MPPDLDGDVVGTALRERGGCHLVERSDEVADGQIADSFGMQIAP
jgi:hypothetical protein